MCIRDRYNTVQSQAASAAGTDNVRLTELSAELRKEREEREALEKHVVVGIMLYKFAAELNLCYHMKLRAKLPSIGTDRLSE